MTRYEERPVAAANTILAADLKEMPSAAANAILANDLFVRPDRPIYFIRPLQVAFIVVIATLVTGLSANAFAYDSPWVGVGLWLTVAVALHTAFAARTVPWIPGVIALVALGQWVMAAWAGYHVPPPVYTLAMALPADEFFRYAVPASALFVLGLYLPLWRVGRRVPRRVTPVLPPDFVRTCDIMIGVGVIASIAQSFGDPIYAPLCRRPDRVSRVRWRTWFDVGPG